jgi:sec-independent protein translocase protein TatA
MLGNLGFPEILIIMVIVLLLFGAKRIPEIAGSMGKGIKEFKKNINEATNEISSSDAPPRYEPRLTQAELDQRRSTTAAAPEEVRPEPKRLI